MQESERGVNLEQGETITLRASAVCAATAGTNGDTVYVQGERSIYTWIIECSDVKTDAGDTLDVYIDTLVGSTWINIVHFDQIIGTDADTIAYWCVIYPTNMTTTDAVADCAVGVCRGVVGSAFRARWVMVDADADGNFTFSVKGYAQ